MNIVIVGPGRMGLALGVALKRAEAVHRLVYNGRSIEAPPHPIFDGPDAAEYTIGARPLPPGTNVVLLAVPDSALSEVAHELAAFGPPPPGCVAFHLAGAISTDVLSPLHSQGYAVGSLHPLQAIADPWHSGDRLFGAAFAIAGEPEAVAIGRRIVTALKGLPLVIAPNRRQLYHAAAVVASNYMIAVLSFSVRLMMQAGVSEQDAVEALLPLVHGTLDNLEHLGVSAALTGPIARGDAETVRLHLARLSDSDRALYSGLGQELLRVARAAGLDPAKAEALDRLLASRTPPELNAPSHQH